MAAPAFTLAPLPTFALPVGGTIRNAEGRDLGDLLRLFAHLGKDARVRDAITRRTPGHLLVLEIDGVLRAAIFVVIDPDGPRGRIELLVVDPLAAAVHKPIEERMIGVAMALCEAYACIELEIGANG